MEDNKELIFDFDEHIGEVRHPNHPDIIVFVKQLDEYEKMSYYADLQKFVTPIVLRDKEEGILWEEDPITKKRKPLVWEQQNVPVSTLMDFLKKVVTGWKGIKNKDGEIPFEPRHLKILFNPKLTVKEYNKEVITKKDGQEIKKIEPLVETPFWSYVQDKALTDGTFGSDPTV